MALHINNWVEHMQNKFVTIKDIVNMKQNDTETFLCLDRNMYDLFNPHFNKGEIPAKQFFKENYIIDYIHNSNLNGLAFWKGISENYVPFYFQLNYKDNDWYPLDKNGYLPDSDPQEFVNLTGVNKYWKDYPETTLVGWRGEMINWKDVCNSPNVFYS